MNQDAFLYSGLFDGDESAELTIAASRRGYVHVARGSTNVNGQHLRAGDALKTGAGTIRIEGGKAAEVLVFDLP
jgi:redox-sensitive bicupin YhaK (pirin superfamily)